MGILSVSLTDSLLTAGFICIGLLLVAVKVRMLYESRAGWLFLIFPVLGAVLAYTGTVPRNSDIDMIAQRGGPVVIEGVVHDAVTNAAGMQVLTIFTEHITYNDTIFHERLQIRAVPRLEEDEPPISAGSRLRLTGTLWPLQPARSPGGFNEQVNLGARRYDYTLRVNSWEEIGSGFSFRSILRELRDRVTATYYEVLPEEKAGILSAMVTGDRSGLTDYVRNLYRDSGIFHVLVISGMHISILGLFVDRILRQITTIKAAALITIGFLCVYCIFTGASTSTVRAVIMAGVLILAKLLHKEPDLVSSASFASLVMLLYEPRWIFDIGFQYSFSAVFGLGFFMLPLRSYIKQRTGIRKGFKMWLIDGVSSSMIVFIVTIPVQIYHFNHLITYSIFVNLLVLPLLSFILIPGFIMGLVGLISVHAAMLFSGVIYFLLLFYESISRFTASLPFSQVLIGSPHYLWTIAFMGILAWLWYLFAGEASQKFKLRISGTVLTLFVVIFGVYSVWPRDPIMIKLDVGQGDAVIIERYGEVFIVDGGGWPLRDAGQNTGTRVIAPYLARRGIRHVDGIFVSHLHRDHALGVVELLELKYVDRLYMSTRIDREYPMYAMLMEAAEYNGVEVVLLQAGDAFESEQGISFLVLSPSAYHNYPSTNEASLVLYVDMGQRVMFTGDIGAVTEELIIQRFSHIDTDILKLAHHGSRFSTGDEFLNAARPRVAIAGVGVHNVFGHPHPTVTNRLYERNIAFYSTSTHGAITINLRNNNITTMIEGGN